MNYKGYPLFNEIKDRQLKAYNRLNIMMNINDAMGEHMAQEYAEQIDQQGRTDLLFMGKMVEKYGNEQIKAIVMKEAK